MTTAKPRVCFGCKCPLSEVGESYWAKGETWHPLCYLNFVATLACEETWRGFAKKNNKGARTDLAKGAKS